MSKTIIINLVGASGSGTTTLAEELQKHGHNILLTHTTLSEPVHEKWYSFIRKHVSLHVMPNGGLYCIEVSDSDYLDNNNDDDDDNVIQRKKKVILYYKDDMIYYTERNNGNDYSFVDVNQIDKGNTNIVITYPDEARQVKEYFKDNDDYIVKTIYLDVDEFTRSRRLIHKIKDKSKLKYISDDDNLTSVPDIWDIVGPDRDIFQNFEADFVLNGHRKIPKVANVLLGYIEELK